MILYEDAQLVVCCKPRGVLSAADSSGQESMAALLAPRTVFPVHRLDRDVPGVMVFAKTREAAAFAVDGSDKQVRPRGQLHERPAADGGLLRRAELQCLGLVADDLIERLDVRAERVLHGADVADDVVGL